MADKFTNKIKIGFIFNHSYFLGGGEVSLFELIRKLDRAKFEPIGVVPDYGEIEKKLKRIEIKVYRSPFPSLKCFIKLLPINALYKLIKLLKAIKFDVLHINGSRACFYGGIAAQVAGIPSIWHVRETKRDHFLYEYFLALMSKIIICVSKSVQNKRFAHFGKLVRKKILVVYNGVDTQSYRKDISIKNMVKKKLNISNQIIFGLVGNIIPLKRQDYFLKGLAKAKEINPNLSIKVLFLGRFLDKEYYENLVKLSKELYLTENVIFTGYQSEIINYLSALDVFVLPSEREGFSRSILEAMSAELPVIATRLSEIEEAVMNNKNAILVEGKNIDEMAKVIITLAENDSLRLKMGKLNRIKAIEKFDLKHHTEAMQDIYQRLTNRGTQSGLFKNLP